MARVVWLAMAVGDLLASLGQCHVGFQGIGLGAVAISPQRSASARYRLPLAGPRSGDRSAWAAQIEEAPGTDPGPMKAVLKLRLSAAMTRSQRISRVAPIPVALPCTATTVGPTSHEARTGSRAAELAPYAGGIGIEEITNTAPHTPGAPLPLNSRARTAALPAACSPPGSDLNMALVRH